MNEKPFSSPTASPPEALATGVDPLFDASGDRPRSRRSRGMLVSPSQIGSANRSRVLQALFELGPTSRAGLARHAGVNRATITGIVQPLIDDRILIEGEPTPVGTSGGKPARPLLFGENAPPVVALALFPGALRSALVSWSGEISNESRTHFALDACDPTAAIGQIKACLTATIARAKATPFGIGVAVAGSVDTDTGTIVAMNLAPILSGQPLSALLLRDLGLPVVINHLPRALLLGDRWFGPGRQLSSFATIVTGKTLGGALFLGGHLQHGIHGAGGELGHTFVQVDGDVCRCGRRGCWETIATTTWLRQQALARALPEAEKIDCAALVALVRGNFAGAAELLDLYARNLAVGIANLQQTIAPNTYVIHGDALGGGEAFLAMIDAHVRQMVPYHPGSRVKLLAGDQEDRNMLRGAAALVLSQRLQFQL